VTRKRRDIAATEPSLPDRVGIPSQHGVDGPQFAERIEEVRREAERFARRRGDPTVAPDIAQDVAIAVWRQFGASPGFLDGSRPTERVIHGMVSRKASRRKRVSSRSHDRDALHTEERADSVHTWMDPDARQSETAIEELDRRARMRMSLAERQVLAMSSGEDGLSYAQIAKVRGTTATTVRKQLISARAIYRELCREMGIEAPPPKRASRPPASE
jgi:RNA polymerase sigma factor (sigma-70 family)